MQLGCNYWCSVLEAFLQFRFAGDLRQGKKTGCEVVKWTQNRTSHLVPNVYVIYSPHHMFICS